MTARRIRAALVAALVAVAVVQLGCAGARPQAGTSPAGEASVGATVSVSGTTSPTATGTPGLTDGISKPSSGAEVSGADLAAIKKQLDAMQKELDGLSMPTDNDFSGAEGAVY